MDAHLRADMLQCALYIGLWFMSACWAEVYHSVCRYVLSSVNRSAPHQNHMAPGGPPLRGRNWTGDEAGGTPGELLERRRGDSRNVTGI